MPTYRYSLPDLLQKSFDVEHLTDAEAMTYALRVARELLESNGKFLGQPLKVMKEDIVLGILTLGRPH